MKKINLKGTNRYIIAIGLGVIVGALVAVLFIFFVDTTKVHEIILTDEGFEPSEITIEVGDTVTFINKLESDFWPASDIHPTHEIYSEFDPQEPLPPGSKWSFTFSEVGEWDFHDHLAPLYIGVIEVLGPSNYEKVSECGLHSEYNLRAKCWGDALENAYLEGGMEKGFDLFADLFNSEFEFAQECHGFTHILGNMAYEDYTAGKDFEVTNQVAYCSYGFFHGFMESLAFETGDYTGSREFCDYIEGKLDGEVSSVGPCIHGIGHGVTDAADPRVYGNPGALIQPGLDLCKELTRTEYEDKICATGIYNALGELYLIEDSGFTYNPEYPYAICREQEESHIKEACYEDLKVLILEMGNNNLHEAIPIVVKIPDDMQYKKAAMENLSLYHTYDIKSNEYEYSVRACQSLAEDELRVSCVRGLAAGFITSGTPDKEYVRALDFCTNEFFTEEERKHCYDRMLQAAYHRYPTETLNTICKIAPEEYHVTFSDNYCLKSKSIGSQ